MISDQQLWNIQEGETAELQLYNSINLASFNSSQFLAFFCLRSRHALIIPITCYKTLDTTFISTRQSSKFDTLVAHDFVKINNEHLKERFIAICPS